MPQAILPDLNSAYIRYRNLILEKISSKDWTLCFGALFAINGILPKDYQVTVSSIEYNKKTQTGLIMVCGYCTEDIKENDKVITRPTEHDSKKVVIYNKLQDSVNQVLTGKKFIKLWDCPKCKKTNKLDKTEIIRTALQEPVHFQVVPNAPERKDGIAQRSNYDIDVEKWILQFLGELEYQMGKYRREYVPKTGTLEEMIFNDPENMEDYR